MPEISKSSRHSKITGDFAEHLVLYWLSKHGFECARVDHVGLDLIARHSSQPHVMGISVKSRSRSKGSEGSYLSIPNENQRKLSDACTAFNCVPYFAIVVDEAESIKCFILSAEILLTLYPPGNRVSSWKMHQKALEAYASDHRIKMFEFQTKTLNWW